MSTLQKLRLQTPLRYIGGKHYLAPWHISRFPEHDLYIDLFFGGGSMLLQKPPGNEIANDVYGDLHNFWTVLRDRKEEFIDRCLFTPVSRELCDLLGKAPVPADPLERAWAFFTLNRQAFSGMGGARGGKIHWSISRRTRRGINEPTSSFLSAVDMLPEVADRLRQVTLECDDFEKIIARYDGPKTFFYCDPPYHLGDGPNTYYNQAFNVEDQRRLALILEQIKGKALVCGVPSPLYERLYGGWYFEAQATTLHASSGSTKNQVQETIWTSYELAEK